MNSVSFQRWFARFHVGVYQLTGGRLGHGLSGNTTLMLTTIGRRSGEARSTVLDPAHGDHAQLVTAPRR